MAAVVPADAASAALLIAAAIMTLICGVARRRGGFVRSVPGVLFVGIGAAAFWPLPLPGAAWATPRVTLIAAATALAIHVLLHRTDRTEPRDSPTGSTRGARVYLGATLLIAAALLLDDLGGYAGTLLTWESSVTAGFADAYLRGQGIESFVAQRLLWDDGILSAGHTSLFYGAPTYALFHVAGFSPWTLRIAAVIATLLSVLTIYAYGRRFFGPVVGGAMAVLFALNTAVLFYGRYGSSPAGTLLAVLLALFATWLFLDRDRSAWWMGAVCAAALYAATLQYSPARPVVLVLLGMIPLVLAYQWRRLWWQRLVGIVVIAAGVVVVWQVQRAHHVASSFLAARGEQFFEFLQAPEQISPLFGKEMLGSHMDPDALTCCDTVELLYRVVETTAPQYLSVLVPPARLPAHGKVIDLDPPPLQLYYAPFGLFIVWGLVHAVLRLPSWRHVCLLAWFAFSSLALLLTNRVDAHRALMLVVPLVIWAALGVWEAVRLMQEAYLPRGVQHLLAAGLIVTLIEHNVNVLSDSEVRPPQAAQDIAAEIEGIEGPVILGALWNHREVGWAHLAMLERARRDLRSTGTLLPEGLLHGLANSGVVPDETYVQQLYRRVGAATVLLTPAEKFYPVAAALQRRGVRVAERGSAGFRMLRFDAGAASTGVSDAQVQPLPAIEIPPTPTPVALREGRRIFLTERIPTEVKYGFAPPETNRQYNGEPIVMGGVRYERGLGTHAWCRMTYAVPPGATSFQAIVGLSDSVKDCPAAAVTFEVRDEHDRLLSTTAQVDPTTPPQAFEVDVSRVTAITLVTTEGGNGRDCDHANWAVPAFLVRAP